MYSRTLSLTDLPGESCFLWGARQTGKSTLLKETFTAAMYYGLLHSDVYRRLLSQPSLLREAVLAHASAAADSRPVIVIDEVQKVPDLLDEVHWMIENTACRFVLCGSSARKLRRGKVVPGSTEYGKAFEHFILMELRAHSIYSGLHYPIRYWRTSSGFEVDAVLGDASAIVEIKSSETITYRDLKGIRAFREEHRAGRAVVVSSVPAPRRTDDGIDILPWQDFLTRLNAGQIIG